jgi:hypothetical protein
MTPVPGVVGLIARIGLEELEHQLERILELEHHHEE